MEMRLHDCPQHCAKRRRHPVASLALLFMAASYSTARINLTSPHGGVGQGVVFDVHLLPEAVSMGQTCPLRGLHESLQRLSEMMLMW